jgi:ABC-type amino acid transport substrate-binding protein
VGFDVELARAIASWADLALGWTRTSCNAGTAPVEEGRVDVLMTSVARLVPGTPSSRVFFSTRAALVSAAEAGRRPHLGDPGPDDVLGLATGGPIARWARRTSGGPGGAELRAFANPDRAYDLLERGALWAVAVSEADAWAAIEHRPGLLVGSTDDIGAHDVMVASTTSTELLRVVDDALAGLLADGSYALLFGKYFPGATLPGAVGA